MAIDALALLEEGLDLYRRTFRRDLWRYYLASAPLAASLLWTWQLNWIPEYRLGLVRLAALILTACTALRILGVGAYSRQMLARLSGTRTSRAAAANLSEFWVATVFILLWWLSLPLLLGVGLFYAAVQYVPLLPDRRLRRALGLSRRWWPQQWLLLALALLFGGIVFSNLALSALLLPPLLHGLFGVGGALGFASTSLFLFRSSLFWFALALATYLLLDPVMKCAMAVSFQRLQSAREGADLAAAVRLLERPAASDAAVHGALAPALRHGGLAAIAVPSLQAQVPTPPGAAQLQRAIHLELSQPAYAWQHPRPAPDSHGLGTLFARLLEFVLKPFVFLGHEFARLAAAIWHWLIRSFLSSPVAPVAGTSGRSWERWELVLAALCLLLAGLVTVRWRQYRGSTSDAIAEPAEVDVATAAVTDQNEGEWFALSARLRENGQWRLALRAAFLGGLAGLGQRRLVTLRRDRTNREYLEEFSRWAVLHASGSTPDDLRQEFGNVVRDFNQVWYGGRDVNLQQLNDFVAAQRRLLSHV